MGQTKHVSEVLDYSLWRTYRYQKTFYLGKFSQEQFASWWKNTFPNLREGDNKDLIYYPLIRPPAGPRQKSITFIKAYMPYKSSKDPTNPSYRESKISLDQQKKSEDEEKATFTF